MTEQEILKFWQENKIFEKSLQKDEGDFVFYDGPPFATGLPHYGHILASIIKDVIPRYQTMKGKKVPRKWGWDCHGLPIENLIERELNLKTKKDIEKYGVENFNKKAEESVLRYADEWKKIIPRIGRWVDMKNDYKTMDWQYTESVWWTFKRLYDKGLIYEGCKPMHICPRCETTLSNFEVTQNYKEIKDWGVTMKFELKDEPGTYVLAWTTTAWTLPGNVALAINKDIVYCKIKSPISNLKSTEFFILAKNRIKDILKDQPYEIVEELKGRDLIGKKYKPLFDYYFKDEKLENSENGWKIYGADFISIEEGTGIVHIAPAFGEEDMQLGQEEKLPFIQHVDTEGKFKPEVKDFADFNVKPKGNPRETDEKIVKWLEKENKLFAKELITHSYPFCWRCETPLLNYAANSWFVNVVRIKDKLLKNNKKINWVPKHLQEGRFGKWLENARDWAISRSRYWGAPLPVWRCEKCGEIKVVGSVEELGVKIDNLHRPYIDKVELDCSCGGKMKRIPEVFDCWFESGSMPFAQAHYPFENKEEFEKNFPAEFIAEGVDQTRGWFYTLLVLSTALFDKPAYKNVVANGIILAEDGQKMSKRLNNYPDPMEIVEKYGADSLRYYLLSSPAVAAESLNFSEKGVDEVHKKVIMRLRNVLAFYKMYTNNSHVTRYSLRVTNILDKWILARLKSLTREITEKLDNYELDKAARPIADFIDDLSTWYIRRSRERFKEENEDKNNAVSATRFVLIEFSKLIAPFMPFVAEEIYQNLKSPRPRQTKRGGQISNLKIKESVHLEEWPKISNQSLVESSQTLLRDMEEARKIVSLALEERAKAGIKVRQPIATLKIRSTKSEIRNNKELLNLIKDEINIKEIIFDKRIENEVEIDTTISDDLKKEGIVRELSRHIQDLRKKAGLKPQDRISLLIETDKNGEKLIKQFENEIKKGTNTISIEFSPNNGEETKIDELKFKIEIKL